MGIGRYVGSGSSDRCASNTRAKGSDSITRIASHLIYCEVLLVVSKERTSYLVVGCHSLF